jgi:hypothetical protein
VGEVIAAAGAPFIDCGIIGLAPGKGKRPTRFHVSGPDTGPMERLDGKGIEVIPMGAEPGRASALKMVYAGLTKGTFTLHTALLVAAWQLGIFEEIAATMASAGVTPAFHEGAAAVFSLLARTPFAAETRETLDESRTLEQAIEVYAQYLAPGD